MRFHRAVRDVVAKDLNVAGGSELHGSGNEEADADGAGGICEVDLVVSDGDASSLGELVQSSRNPTDHDIGEKLGWVHAVERNCRTRDGNSDTATTAAGDGDVVVCDENVAETASGVGKLN